MYLGIDVGTSAVKAVIVDEAGTIIDQASSPLSLSRPRPLWSEQNPADWWSATNEAVTALPSTSRKAVRAIGLSGQMHGATVLGKAHEVLRPAILWNDGRSAAQCAELEALVPGVTAITGNRAMPGFTAPKLLWLKHHEPETFRAIAKVLLPKDFIRLHITGEAASDMSDSAGTLWLDVGNRRWSRTMLDATGLRESHMPALFEGNQLTGQLRTEIAASWGMGKVAVAAGGGDNAAGAVGVGAVHVGDALLSLGTSGVIFLPDDRYRPNAQSGVHTFCHALPHLWHEMSVALSAASCLEWASRICGVGGATALIALAERAASPTINEVFLPYLSGERTPHNDPNAKGVFFGLTHDTDAASLAQAVLEGVAFAFRDGLEALFSTGGSVDLISVIGGGARSSYWGKILSSVLEKPLAYRDARTVGPAYGAARLARLAQENSNIDDVCTAPAVTNIVEPDTHLTELYRHKFQIYRGLYQQLKPLFAETTS